MASCRAINILKKNCQRPCVQIRKRTQLLNIWTNVQPYLLHSKMCTIKKRMRWDSILYRLNYSRLKIIRILNELQFSYLRLILTFVCMCPYGCSAHSKRLLGPKSYRFKSPAFIRIFTHSLWNPYGKVQKFRLILQMRKFEGWDLNSIWPNHTFFSVSGLFPLG